MISLDLMRSSEVRKVGDRLNVQVANDLKYIFWFCSKVREALGLDKCPNKFLGSAAAPISVDTLLYFQSLDIMISEFFGSTETSGPQTCCGEGKPTNNFYSYYYSKEAKSLGTFVLPAS